MGAGRGKVVGLVAVVVGLGLAVGVMAAQWSAAPADLVAPVPSPSVNTSPTADAESPDVPAAESGPGVLRVWIPGGFDPDVMEAAAALPDVIQVIMSRSDTLGLVGSRDREGQPVDVVADGFRIPVTVVAIDPVAAVDQMGEDDDDVRAAVAGLAPGQVLLTESAAALRGIGVGGEVDLVGRTGLQVVAVVPDDTLRRTEMAVHQDEADSLGLSRAGALTIVHDAAPGPATDALVAALIALAPPDTMPRVMLLTGEGLRAFPLVLSLSERKEIFGEFAYRLRSGVREIDIDPAFIAEHIVDAQVPLLGTVRCHRRVIDDLRAALTELVDAGLGEWIDSRRYGGCFHARQISTDRARLSTHAWGAAIDINVDFAQPGLGPVPPEEMIEILGRHGFRWGGDFSTPDHHHWEWIGAGATDRPDHLAP